MKLINFFVRPMLVLLVLEFSFAIHEYGHLREYQKRGVAVAEYSLGIGPRLYSYQTGSSLTVSIRLLPIMAYVAPTNEGGEYFRTQAKFWDKVGVYTAGVRNNILVGLSIVVFLQILGWRRGNLSTGALAKTIMVTLVKIPLRFVAFLIGCITWGRINLARRHLLSTGGIDPSRPLKLLIVINLVLGLFNLAPVPPLDGGHALEAVLLSTGVDIYLPKVSTFMGVILFFVFYAAASTQDTRVLEFERDPTGKLRIWEEEGENASEVLLRRSIAGFLSTRVSNLLRNSDIRTIGKLRKVTASRLLEIRGFGPKSLMEVEAALRTMGLSLKPEDFDQVVCSFSSNPSW